MRFGYLGPPFSYGIAAPASWLELDEEDRKRRGVLGDDQCELDEHRFVRGRIVIPVIDAPHSFEWGVWVSLSASNYERMAELWHQPGRESEPPYFGWLCTSLPTYPSTLHLKTLVHTRPVGERPLIELEPTEHPLAIEQREGITLRRVIEIAERLLHF